MALTVQTFMRNSRSLARVMNYIGTRLDDEICLADVAELAELSRAHFLRLYAEKIRETPMHTLRRLRLQRARAQIESGRTGLAHVGADAGYGSNAAFTHAFVRQFGMAPSQVPRVDQVPAAARPGFRLAWMPMTPVVAMPYRGDQQFVWSAGAEISARVAVSGAKRWRFWHWLDLDNPLVERAGLMIDSVCLTHISVGHRIGGRVEVPGLDDIVLPGGPHAVFRVAGQQRVPGIENLTARIETLTDWQREHTQRILYRELQVSAYRAPQDRLVEVWVPLRRR